MSFSTCTHKKFILIIVGIWIAAFSACNDHQKAPPGTITDTGSVSGTALDPLGPARNTVAIHGPDNFSTQTTPDALGHFMIEQLAAGVYQAVIQFDGDQDPSKVNFTVDAGKTTQIKLIHPCYDAFHVVACGGYQYDPASGSLDFRVEFSRSAESFSIGETINTKAGINGTLTIEWSGKLTLDYFKKSGVANTLEGIWKEDDGGANLPEEIRIVFQQDKVFKVIKDSFETKPPYHFAIRVTGNGTVSSDDLAINCGSVCDADYEQIVDPLTLTAVPTAESVFTGWSGDCFGLGTETTIVIDRDMACSANFVSEFVNFTLIPSGTIGNEGVFVTVNITEKLFCAKEPREPADIQAPCVIKVARGSHIFLQHRFVEGTTNNHILWQGCDTDRGLDGCIMQVNDDQTVTAVFSTKEYTLTVLRNPVEGGIITVDQSPLDCTVDCSGQFAGLILIKAEPAQGFAFVDWQGDCSGTNVSVFVDMVSNKNCEANFEKITHSLHILKQGTGNGRVISNPGAIDCGSVCNGTFDDGAQLTLTYEPDANSVLAGTSSECDTLVMTKDIDCPVTFNLKTHTLSISTTGLGTFSLGGIVSSSDGSIVCGTQCAHAYNHGDSVTLSVNLAGGVDFLGWGGGCVSENKKLIINVNMTQAISCTAGFKVNVVPIPGL